MRKLKISMKMDGKRGGLTHRVDTVVYSLKRQLDELKDSGSLDGVTLEVMVKILHEEAIKIPIVEPLRVDQV